MKTNARNIEILNDLIRINDDRASGYERAVKEVGSSDKDLKAIFNSFASESRTYANELSRYITYSGVNFSEQSSPIGKIYKAWADRKATFNGKDIPTILSACESGEESTQKAYTQALETDSDSRLSPDIRHVIEEQKGKLKDSYNRIKRLKNMNTV